MDRVAEPLRMMGASVTGSGDHCRPPIIVGGGDLQGIEYTPPMASAQVKSAVLLAGLRASGETVVREPVATRAHTEEVLTLAGVDLEVREEGGGREVRIRPSVVQPFDLDIPGDPSQAAFWVVAACLVPRSEVRLEGVYVGAARRGFLDVLRRMGASIDEVPTDGAGPTADLVARYSPLRSTEILGEEIPSLDEVPILAVAAALAEGTTIFRRVGSELRVKESDRMAGTADLLRAFGVEVEIVGDDLEVHGAERLSPPERVDARGDHRMAMAAAVASMAAGPGRATTVTGWEAVATSYPGFLDVAERLSGESEQR
jgi:3-phosphoshikimate 1-carboxyvinyltransferase